MCLIKKKVKKYDRFEICIEALKTNTHYLKTIYPIMPNY